MQYTEDTIWRPDIRILQPVSGYRFAIDSVLLAHFIRTEPEDRLLEIGAGSGVVTILLSALQTFSSVVAIEVQPELAGLCQRNFENNGIRNGVVYEEDVRRIHSVLPNRSFDVIYSNPPYRRAGSGKLNPSKQKAIARHEIRMTLRDLCDCAGFLLKDSGKLVVIMPSYRESNFKAELIRCEMHVQEWKYVHSFANEPPAFFLASAGKESVPLVQQAPWVIYDTTGEYTLEVKNLLYSPL